MNAIVERVPIRPALNCKYRLQETQSEPRRTCSRGVPRLDRRDRIDVARSHLPRGGRWAGQNLRRGPRERPGLATGVDGARAVSGGDCPDLRRIVSRVGRTVVWHRVRRRDRGFGESGVPRRAARSHHRRHARPHRRRRRPLPRGSPCRFDPGPQHRVCAGRWGRLGGQFRGPHPHRQCRCPPGGHRWHNAGRCVEGADPGSRDGLHSLPQEPPACRKVSSCLSRS